MKLKEILPLVGVLIAAFLLAYGISLLAPVPEDPYAEADEELRALVGKLYDLPNPGVYIRKQEENYYLLEICTDRVEGAGCHWSVTKRMQKAIQEIEGGQYCAPSCTAVTNASVPVSIIQYCRKNPAIYDDGIIDRENGESIPDPSPICL